MIPPKRFDIFFSLTGGCSEGLDALIFSLKQVGPDKLVSGETRSDFSSNTRLRVVSRKIRTRLDRTRLDLLSIPQSGVAKTKKKLFMAFKQILRWY